MIAPDKEVEYPCSSLSLITQVQVKRTFLLSWWTSLQMVILKTYQKEALYAYIAEAIA